MTGSQNSPLSHFGNDLSARRTEMSFQRTRFAADRTLMAVIRTSLSLISFGFTIYKIIQGLQENHLLDIRDHAARNFGVTLVIMGILALAGGIAYHLRFMVHLRRQRASMIAAGNLHPEEPIPLSITLILAVILLLAGIFAVTSMLYRVGPFI